MILVSRTTFTSKVDCQFKIESDSKDTAGIFEALAEVGSKDMSETL